MALNEQQLIFIEWLITPKHLRQPPQQEDLAKILKVTPKTLTVWKHHPEFEQAVAAATIQWGAKKLPGIIQALFKYAESPMGGQDRATIVKYFMPNVARLRDQGF